MAKEALVTPSRRPYSESNLCEIASPQEKPVGAVAKPRTSVIGLLIWYNLATQNRLQFPINIHSQCYLY